MNKLLLGTAAAAILALGANAAYAQTKTADFQVSLTAFEKKNCEILATKGITPDDNGTVRITEDFGTPDQFDSFEQNFRATCNFAADAVVTAQKGIFRNDDGISDDSGDGEITNSGFTFAIPYEILFQSTFAGQLEDDASLFTGPGQTLPLGAFADATFLLEINAQPELTGSETFLGGSYSDVVTVRFGPPA